MVRDDPNRIGLVAGWGRFPIVLAETLRAQGYHVTSLGIKGHADPVLAEICDEFVPVGIAKLGRQIRLLRNRGVTKATMAGKLFKTILFKRFAWLKHSPDWTCVRYFYPLFITKTRTRTDDSLLLTVVQAYADAGICFAPATDFAPELLVKTGTLSQRKLTNYEAKDISFAWDLAKEMGRMDIGQSVVVKGRAVLAVEAVEGTDECIRRAGRLCPSGGFTIVKVAKPQQDMRFDVPTIGLGTLQTMHAAGGRVLAVEADQTILIDQQEVMNYADQHGLTVVAIDAAESQQMSRVA